MTIQAPIVSGAAEIPQWGRVPAAEAWRHIPTVDSLVAAGVPRLEAMDWVDSCSALRGECGCKVGTSFFMAAASLYPAAWALGLLPLSSFWPAAALWPLACVAAAVVGKTLAVGIARARLGRRLASMQARIAGADHPDPAAGADPLKGRISHA